MSSLTLYADRALQDLDASCVVVIGGAKTALADDTTYRVQNTGLDSDGRPVGAHHYVYLIRTASEPESAADLKRARAAAEVLEPNGEHVTYKKAAGVTGFIWSPYGEVSVSVNPSP